jgi:hypothetical protein
MKYLILLLISIISIKSIHPHSGIVIDSNGEPQFACKITAPDLNVHTYTDFDGKYSIEVPDCTLLMIEYISYETQFIVSVDNAIVVLKDHQFNFNPEIQ